MRSLVDENRSDADLLAAHVAGDRYAFAELFHRHRRHLYRLARPEEAFELGLDEALDDGAAVIEWPERLEGALPANRLDIELSAPPGGGRLAHLTGHGAWTNRMEDLLR